MKTAQKHPLMWITWKDAESESKWQDKDEVAEWAGQDCLVQEIGWLIYENKDYIVICNQIVHDGDFGNKTKIPTGWVVKRQKVRLK